MRVQKFSMLGHLRAALNLVKVDVGEKDINLILNLKEAIDRKHGDLTIDDVLEIVNENHKLYKSDTGNYGRPDR